MKLVQVAQEDLDALRAADVERTALTETVRQKNVKIKELEDALAVVDRLHADLADARAREQAAVAAVKVVEDDRRRLSQVATEHLKMAEDHGPALREAQDALAVVTRRATAAEDRLVNVTRALGGGV